MIVYTVCLDTRDAAYVASTSPSCTDSPMPLVTASPPLDIPLEQLAGSVERVTLHSEEIGFCMLPRQGPCSPRARHGGRRDPHDHARGVYREPWLVDHRPHPWLAVEDRARGEVVPSAPHSKALSHTWVPAWAKVLVRTLPAHWCRPSVRRSLTSLRSPPPACRHSTASVPAHGPRRGGLGRAAGHVRQHDNVGSTAMGSARPGPYASTKPTAPR